MNVSKPIDSRNKPLFNKPKKSDVRFLVDGQTVYGHKQILGSGSPVFKSMFFGKFEEPRDVIEIKDLSLIGFKNALRYIYGHRIDYALTDLHDTYLAADYYLLHHFNEAFFKYIKGQLSSKNSCLIYEQLMRIGDRVEITLAHVRSTIRKRSKKVFESKHFTEIGKETLISLLSLDQLEIAEIDLLAAVSKWVDCEVQRQGLPVNRENRRRVFEPIEGYILFTALTPERLANCKEIAGLFTPEEIGLLCLHLLNKEYPLTIQLKTPRKIGASICSVFVSDSREDDYECCDENEEEDFNSIEMLLTVNRKVSIHAIHTTLDESADLSLEIRDLYHQRLNLKMTRFEKDDKLSFSLDPPFDVQPNSSFRLVANVDETIEEASEQNELDYKGLVIFNVHRESPNCLEFHCLRGLDFSLLD